MIRPYELYFNRRTKGFLSPKNCGGSTSIDSDCVKVDDQTAVRLKKKFDLISALDRFLSLGVEKARASEPSLGEYCSCKIDGKWFDILVANDWFIPVEVPWPSGDKKEITLEQYRAIVIDMLRKEYYSTPVDVGGDTEFAEFIFYADGVASDGSGIEFYGDVCGDGHIRLFVCYPHENSGRFDEERRSAYRLQDESYRVKMIARVSREEFAKNIFDRNNRKKTLASECLAEQRRLCNPVRDQIIRGKIDIYGDPDGWQFNNEN